MNNVVRAVCSNMKKWLGNQQIIKWAYIVLLELLVCHRSNSKLSLKPLQQQAITSFDCLLHHLGWVVSKSDLTVIWMHRKANEWLRHISFFHSWNETSGHLSIMARFICHSFSLGPTAFHGSLSLFSSLSIVHHNYRNRFSWSLLLMQHRTPSADWPHRNSCGSKPKWMESDCRWVHADSFIRTIHCYLSSREQFSK